MKLWGGCSDGYIVTGLLLVFVLIRFIGLELLGSGCFTVSKFVSLSFSVGLQGSTRLHEALQEGPKRSWLGHGTKYYEMAVLGCLPAFCWF